MNNIAVVVLTVKRKTEQYLPETIRSMRSRDPLAGSVRIIASVGSAERMECHSPVEFTYIPERELEPYAESHGAYKLTVNLLHAMRLARDTEAKTVVVAEDDLKMSRNWLQRCVSLSYLARSLYPDWMITACTSHGLSDLEMLTRTSYMGDHLASFRDPAAYWGNQCMVFPRSTLLMMIEHVQTCISEWVHTKDPMATGGSDFKRIGDQAVKNFFVNRNVPLLASIPSLAKHVGRINSWQNAESVAWRHPTARFES